MPGTALLTRHRGALARSLARSLAGLATACVPLAVASGATAPETAPPRVVPAVTASAAGAPFTVATYNALFASHTDGRRPRRAEFPDSAVRTARAVRLFRRTGIDIAGVQELEPRARGRLGHLAPEYRVHAAGTTAVVWRRSDFAFVAARTIRTRSYHGRLTGTPVVRLRQRTTQQELVVMSVHNPSDSRGPATALRDDATRTELAEVLRHRRGPSPVPVLVLGDMNSRARFFCAFTATGDMHAAAGGSHADGRCEPPSFAKGIDWIMGSTDVAFSGFRDDHDTRRASDHPLITAVARMAP